MEATLLHEAAYPWYEYSYFPQIEKQLTFIMDSRLSTGVFSIKGSHKKYVEFWERKTGVTTYVDLSKRLEVPGITWFSRQAVRQEYEHLPKHKIYVVEIAGVKCPLPTNAYIEFVVNNAQREWELKRFKYSKINF